MSWAIVVSGGLYRWGCLVAAAVMVTIAAGCAAGPGDESTEVAGGSLVELQTALPTGNAPEWYTQRLDDLDYHVASLRYQQSDMLAYQVVKGATSFQIQLTLDPELGTASLIEINQAAIPADISSMQTAAPEPEPVPTPQPSSEPRETPAPQPTPTPRPNSEPRPTPEPQPTPTPQPRSEPPVAVDQPSSEVPRAEPPFEPRYHMVALPAGTMIPASLNDFLDSGKSQVGDTFSMTVTESVEIAGIEVLPVGSRIWGFVADVEGARRPNNGGRLVLKADAIDAHGGHVAIEGLITAEGERLEGEGSVKEDIKEIAVGAGVGGLVGGLLGGGKGVLAGILIGGGGTFVATKGEQVELPPDTPLYVDLRQEVSIPVPQAP